MIPHDDDIPEQKSKSQLKREMSELQTLGAELVELAAADLALIELPDTLREAVTAARNMRQHEARRRQLQYIGRLMRAIDATPIRAALEALTHRHHQSTAHHHTLEHWRDRLLAEGDPAIAALLAEYPAADRQRLRQLTRESQQEKVNHNPPRAARKLFQYLREIMPH